MSRSMSFVLALGCALGLSTHATAASKSGVTMPDTVKVGGETLVLNGLGTREATMFSIDVYVAGLYIPKKTNDAASIINGDYAKQIHMTFVRDVERDSITEAYVEAFEKNGDMKAQGASLKTLNGWMVDVEDGQSMTLTYEPGKGTTVDINGKNKGTVPGFGFAKALWKVWLGANPPNKGLKTGMLGKG